MKKSVTLIALLCLVLSGGTAVAAVPGGGDLSFTPANAKPVIFSHDLHVNIKDLKCSACHNHTFQMAKDSSKMDMSKINKGQFCGHCHNGEKAFDVKDKANCGRCHK
ncbi:MAG TPA: cytochrome c3 family protein [Nitrospirota bacterium]|nr:cytochrome c3 family protein [Nitrospirota bacterium]